MKVVGEVPVFMSEVLVFILVLEDLVLVPSGSSHCYISLPLLCTINWLKVVMCELKILSVQFRIFERKKKL